MKEVECPYCEKEVEINHDDGFGYEEGVIHSIQCPYCDKYFVFETYISWSYKAEKADCLNDGEHDFKPTHTIPSAFTEMECTMCGERRELTDEERTLYKIERKEIYFNWLKS